MRTAPSPRPDGRSRRFSTTSVDERIALIDRIIDVYESYIDEFSELIAREVGIPVSNRAQVTGPADHMRVARDMLRDYPFESRIGSAIVRREPIGVCALISPWNWPIQTGVIKIDLRAGRRVHGRRQTQHELRCQRRTPRPGAARGRRAAGRVQPGQRRRPRAWATPCPATRAWT